MSVRSLCVEPHPALRAQAHRVEEFTKALRELARDLVDTMYAHRGIGLAAPQVGEDLQLIVASPEQVRGRELIIVNPVLDGCEGRAGIVEGCLSVPNVWERVKRSARVRLTGQKLDGQPITIDAEGLLAIVLQHEVDHLQGRLFLDRLSWFRRLRVRLIAPRRVVCAPAES